MEKFQTHTLPVLLAQQLEQEAPVAKVVTEEPAPHPPQVEPEQQEVRVAQVALFTPED